MSLLSDCNLIYMSKIIYTCFRNEDVTLEQRVKIEAVCEQLKANNISARPSHIFSSGQIVYGISNPPSAIETDRENVVFGKLFSSQSEWAAPQSPAPDGNFVIIRATSHLLEVLTDCLGTRTMWYLFDEEKIILSSSQKAIIDFIGKFEFNEYVIPWVLSNGSLGPSFSWDKRIKRIPPDGRLLLNRKTWKLSVVSSPVIFEKSWESSENHQTKLVAALGEIFSSLDLDLSRWVVTLSGGYDSRAILLLIKQHFPFLGKKLKTVTWGERASLLDTRSDAFIADLLSVKEDTDHSYFHTEKQEESLEKVIQRFLENGEGRIDHISGYMDGFNIWKTLYENKYEGVIRGDEVFGYNAASTPWVVKNFMGLTLLSDYSNIVKYPYLSSMHQEVPEILEQKKGESISTWRDRIFQMYRIPVIQASLAELKDPYLEQINPFLSRKIVMMMRKMPDQLRTDKMLFRKVIQPLDNGIPYSRRDSNTPLNQLVAREDFKTMIRKELSSNHASQIFPKEFLYQIQSHLESEPSKEYHQVRKRIMGLVPKNVKSFLVGRRRSFNLDENILAFRVFIICRMHTILSCPNSQRTTYIFKIEKANRS